MRTKEEILADIEEDKARIREIDSTYAGQYLDPESDDGKAWEERNQRIDENQRTVEQIEKREQRIGELAGKPEHREEGVSFHTAPASRVTGEDIFDLSTVRASVSDPRQQGSELRDRAMRAVEKAHISEIDKYDDADRSKGRIDGLLRKTDSVDGAFARYLLAVGSPTYKRAFTKFLATRDTSMMDRQEQSAWAGGQMAQRAMSLTGSAGGFAVPFELDTTILNTNNGVANPIRSLARVVQTTVDEWRGITSTGITASYVAEATETTDNSPTLAQPVVSTERAHAFVPFSIEIGMDWGSIQDDLTVLFRDAKDVLESSKFVSGSGTNEPFGVLTGTTNTVAAAAGLTVTLANIYSLKNALPPRYRNGASPAFLANVAVLDRFRQFDTVGSQTAVWQDGLQAGVPVEPARLPRLRGVGHLGHDHERDQARHLRRLLAVPDPRPRRPDGRLHPAPLRVEPAADRPAWPVLLLAERREGHRRQRVPRPRRHHLIPDLRKRRTHG
jgi:HK97 family phage major capsid protein